MAKFDLGKYKLTPKGEYNADTTYEELDVITYNFSSYLVLKTVTGEIPSDDRFNYQLLAGGVNPVIANDIQTKAKKSKLEPIRTVIIGDETTYQDADIISYSDEEATQVQQIAICVDDNGKPFHLKETWIKSHLPSRTDTTSTYRFICNPYTFVNLNSSGIPINSTGIKLCNHTIDVSTLTAKNYNQCYAKFDDEANAYYSFDTGNYASSSVDTMTTWRSWGTNPKMAQDNAWGNTQREVMCNGALVYSNTDGVPLATGTKIEIYGVRKDED